MPSRQWFGREPAIVIQTISALLAVAIGFGLPGLNDGTAAGITALLTAAAGVYTAWAVRPVSPAIFTGVITTGAALAAAFGFDLPQTQVSLVVAGVTAVMTLLTRSQVTPDHDPDPALTR